MTEEAQVVLDDVVDGTPPDETLVDPFEERARRMGWRPQDEYNGPKGRWVDAKTFVERGETELPIIRERFRKLDDRLAATERELTGTRTELKETRSKITEQSEVISELRDLSVSAAQRGYSRAVAELAERERRAVEEANVNAYDRIQVEKRQLEETAPKVEPKRPVEPRREEPARTTQQPGLTPDETVTVTQWIADNPWYNQDPELQAVAISLHGLFKQQNPNQPLADNLAEVKERLVTRYPEKFGESPRQRRAAAVASSSAPPPSNNGKKTVRDLPPEAKAALEKFKRTIPGYKDQDYLDVYFAGEQ